MLPSRAHSRARRLGTQARTYLARPRPACARRRDAAGAWLAAVRARAGGSRKQLEHPRARVDANSPCARAERWIRCVILARDENPLGRAGRQVGVEVEVKVDTAFPKSYRRTARMVYASTTRRDACQRQAAYERVTATWPGTEGIEHQTCAEIGRPRSGRRRRRRLGEQLSWAAARNQSRAKESSGRPGVLLAWRNEGEGEGEGNPEHDLNGRSECAWNCLRDAYCVVSW